jgi:RNA polymerase sigma-70 factor (ECF subfamily)
MFRATGSTDTASDLSQDAFLKAYEKLGQYHPRKKFFSWLYTLSINLVRDHLRQHRRLSGGMEYEVERLSGYPGAKGASGTDFIERHALHQALSRLPIDYREALILRFKEGFSMKEIAQMLSISTSGAKMRVHRGVEQLRTLIAGDQNGAPSTPSVAQAE